MVHLFSECKQNQEFFSVDRETWVSVVKRSSDDRRRCLNTAQPEYVSDWEKTEDLHSVKKPSTTQPVSLVLALFWVIFQRPAKTLKAHLASCGWRVKKESGSSLAAACIWPGNEGPRSRWLGESCHHRGWMSLCQTFDLFRGTLWPSWLCNGKKLTFLKPTFSHFPLEDLSLHGSCDEWKRAFMGVQTWSVHWNYSPFWHFYCPLLDLWLLVPNILVSLFFNQLSETYFNAL